MYIVLLVESAAPSFYGVVQRIPNKHDLVKEAGMYIIVLHLLIPAPHYAIVLVKI